MAISLVASSDAIIVGSNRSDFILASGYANAEDEIFPETVSNRMRGRGGNDLVVGDIGAIYGNVGARDNSTQATALDLDDLRFWTTDESPLFGNSGVPHMTILSDASVGQREYFKIALAEGQRLTVDLDFGSGIGTPSPIAISAFMPSGQGYVPNPEPAAQGGLGSYENLEEFPGMTSDPYLTFVAQATGTYYIILDGFGGPFPQSATFMLSISVTGHAVYAQTAMGADTIDGDAGDDMLLGIAGTIFSAAARAMT